MGQLLLDGVPIGVPDRSVTAAGVSYDNTQSGLSATDVQGAVDELATDSGWLTTTAVNGNTVKYRKIGKQVWIRRGSVGTIDANTSTTIGILPSGYRPVSIFQFGIISEESGGDYGQLIVRDTGVIQYRGRWANTVGSFYVSFLID